MHKVFFMSVVCLKQNKCFVLYAHVLLSLLIRGSCAYQMSIRTKWCSWQRSRFYRSILPSSGEVESLQESFWWEELVTLSDWSTKPPVVLIWNRTRGCLPVSPVMHLHELRGAGQLLEKFSDTFQQMCWQLSVRHATKTCTMQSHSLPSLHTLWTMCILIMQ